MFNMYTKAKTSLSNGARKRIQHAEVSNILYVFQLFQQLGPPELRGFR